MATLDFITALARVLHHGGLRDAFAADARGFVRTLDLADDDCARFLHLVPADLETQARILVRKRFDLVRRLLPQTCQQLGREAWPEFLRYGRDHAPTGSRALAEDCLGFSEYVRCQFPAASCAAERQRSQFQVRAQRLALHFNRALSVRGKRRPGLQVLWRTGESRYREWRLFLGG